MLTFRLFLSVSILLTPLKGEQCGLLYLTVPSQPGRKIEINWILNCAEPPYLLQLNNSQKILDQIETNQSHGYYKSKQSFPRKIKFPGNWNEGDVDEPIQKSLCFDYVLSVIKDGKEIARQCLNFEPAWMRSFGELRIGELMIPGTHNSGAYKGMPGLIKNFILNQDRSFWEQLVMGIRYFDIRVGRYGKDQLYINHNTFRCSLLRPELESVLSFVEKSPKEVVILNFHRFPSPMYFKPKYHQEVLNLIWEVLGKYIYRPPVKDNHPKGPKLNEILDDGKNVIISYNQYELIGQIDWLWPTIKRDWGNVQTVEDLESYIREVTTDGQPGNPMRVLMAELTPTVQQIGSIVTYVQNFGLKGMADQSNPKLDPWLRERNRAKSVNIIATDYFMGNNMINLAIEMNENHLENYRSNSELPHGLS